jgi:hypothetical protein
MQVQLDQNTMETMIQEAIFNSMTDETRQELLKKAIASLMSVPSNGWSKTSPLTDALQSAARSEAERLAKEELQKSPEFQAQLQGLFQDVVTKLFGNEVREKLVQRICDSIISGLNARDY